MSQPKISNDYLAAALALLATLAGLYIVGGIANPMLFGLGDDDNNASSSP